MSLKRKDLKVGDRFVYASCPSKPVVVVEAGFDYRGAGKATVPKGFDWSSPETSVLCQDEEVELIEPVPALTDSAQEDHDLTASPHYTALSPEPINVIESWGLNYRLGNVVKYISRHGRKPGVDALDDLIKARNYLTREINAIRGKPSWLASS